jgi:PAS domain S-box-containing protein
MLATDIRDALTTAMMHSAAPMVLCDPHVPDCPMISVNQAFSDLCGYPADAILGQNCRFLQGPRTDGISTARIRDSLAAGLGCIEWIVNYRRDGEMFYNLLFISPIRSQDGALLYYFGNQLDITMGAPAWLSEVSFGTAHVVPDLEQEFHALMREVTVAARTQALEQIVAAAHRLAEISVKLAPGTLETVKPWRA